MRMRAHGLHCGAMSHLTCGSRAIHATVPGYFIRRALFCLSRLRKEALHLIDNIEINRSHDAHNFALFHALFGIIDREPSL